MALIKWVDLSGYNAILTIKGLEGVNYARISRPRNGEGVISPSLTRLLNSQKDMMHQHGVFAWVLNDNKALLRQLNTLPLSKIINVDPRAVGIISGEKENDKLSQHTRQPSSGNDARGGGDLGRARQTTTAHSGEGQGSADAYRQTNDDLEVKTASDNGLPGVVPTGPVGETDSRGGDLDVNAVRADAKGPNPNHFFLSDETQREGGFSAKARYEENKAAILLIETIASDQRLALYSEKQVLTKFNGWGGLASVLSRPGYNQPQWTIDGHYWLRDNLDEEVRAAASNSVLTGHFTSPEVASAIWEGITLGGFEGGRILEPASGSGVFLGTAPLNVVNNSAFTTIEKDPISASITAALYPDGTHYATGYENAPVPDKSFDLAITNVPFGNFKVFDKKYNKHGLSIHDYFIVKSLDKLKTGGLAVFITSRHTLDKQNDAARRLMAQYGELVTAIRQPASAQKSQANVEVVTDILVFRKREKKASLSEVSSLPWITSSPLDELKNDLGSPVPLQINDYYHQNPEHVLGSMVVTSGQAGRVELGVVNDDKESWISDITDLLRENIHAVLTNRNSGWTDEDINQIDQEYTVESNVKVIDHASFSGALEGSFMATDAGEVGTVTQIVEGNIHYEVTKLKGKPRDRVLGMIAVRDAMNAVILGQIDEAEDEQKNKAYRDTLNTVYDDFISHHGAINSSVNERLFREDPEAGRLRALESVDAKTKEIKKADIFTQRIIGVEPEIKIETALDALNYVVGMTGKVDAVKIASLVGISVEDAINNLAATGDVFFDPTEDNWVIRSKYLSGDVKTKLDTALSLADENPLLMDNVAALRTVIPDDIPLSDVTIGLGATWLEADLIRDFLADLMDDNNNKINVERLSNGSWMVDIPSYFKGKTESIIEYGSRRMPATVIIDRLISGSPIAVYDTIKDGQGKSKSVLNASETTVAQEKSEQILAAFRDYLADDPEREAHALRLYNDTVNRTVTPEYDGRSLLFPGMNAAIELRDVQKNVVMRSIQEGRVVLAHKVGVGKAQPLDAKLLTPSGWVLMGDIKPGDKVVTQSGKATDVVAVYPQGSKDIYRVTMSDGSYTECCDEHLWLTQTYKERTAAINERRFNKDWPSAKPKVRSLLEIKKSLIATHLNAKNHSIPVVKPVEFEERDIPLDPYLLGALLGDGGFTSSSVTITSKDESLVDSLVLPENVKLKRCEYKDRCPTWAFRMVKLKGFGANKEPNPVVEKLKSLNLMGLGCADKFIPDNYLFNTVKNRISLLQGLMDTDGYVSQKGTSSFFYTVSSKLADNVVTLVQSLGGTVRRSIKRSPTYTYDGEIKRGKDAHILCINISDIDLFRLERKASLVRPKTKYKAVRYIVNVEFVGVKPAQCIQVSDPSHLYVTDDFIVTHNTYSMIASAMETKRLGLAAKPMIIVPNNMLEQIHREGLQLYPNANILAISRNDLKADKRKTFLGKIVNNNWDIIIATHNVFGDIPLDNTFKKDYVVNELSLLRTSLDVAESQGAKRFTLKQIEGQITKKEVALETIVEAISEDTDQGVTFGMMGIDWLAVDEFHNFKNLMTSSSNPALAIGGSQRATDLHMKIQFIFEKRGEPTGVVLASGTPVSNSIAELHVIQRYIQPDILEETGMSTIDAWAQSFIATKSQFEPAPGGNGFKLRSRPILVNAPELLGMVRQVMDVKTAEDAGITLPVVDKEIFSTPMTDGQEAYTAKLAERAERLGQTKVDPREDNILKIVSEGRQLALHSALFDEPSDDLSIYSDQKAETKLDELIRNAMESYEESSSDRGVQAIFCDMGTPSAGRKGRVNVYDILKEKLLDQGVPINEIAYAHDANTDKQKAALFEQVRQGSIRFIIGSTQKMGEGTNMQQRLVHLHHLDPPWRPSDIEQRNGRIERFGNLFIEKGGVKISIYTTKGSFDEYMWTVMKAKNDVLTGIMAGNKENRVFDDGMDHTCAEVLAIVTNNPLLKEKMESEQLVNKLSSLSRGFSSEASRLNSQILHREAAIADCHHVLAVMAELPDIKPSGEEDTYVWTIADKDPDTGDLAHYVIARDVLAARVGRQIRDASKNSKVGDTIDFSVTVYIEGHEVVVSKEPSQPMSVWELNGKHYPGSAAITSTLAGRETQTEQAERSITFNNNEIDKIKQQIKNKGDNPFEADLILARERLNEINERIANDPEGKSNSESAPTL